MRAYSVALISAIAVLTATTAFADPAQPSASAQATASAASQPDASAPPSAPVSQAEAANDSLDQVVCRNAAPTTGTRLGGHRVCHTQREWNQQQRDSQNVLTHVQGMTLGGNPSGH